MRKRRCWCFFRVAIVQVRNVCRRERVNAGGDWSLQARGNIRRGVVCQDELCPEGVLNNAPMGKLGDFNGDGLDDLLSLDTNPILSTPDNPVTEWRVARNQGNAFAAPQVAFMQEWSFVFEVLKREQSKRQIA